MEALDKGRRLARRRMGWVAFCSIMIEAVALFAGVYFGGPLYAANLAAAAPIITGIIWAQAALVGAYLGVSLTEALKR